MAPDSAQPGVTSPTRLYESPTCDEPLDEIEQALVRALTTSIVRQIREEAARGASKDQAAPIVRTRRRAG